MTTIYDLDRASESLRPERLKGRAPTMWRYDALLPLSAADAVSLGEGGSPLLDAPQLARAVGLRSIWIKDESRNPTWSFKDRGAAVSASIARIAHHPALVVASTGNAAAATAAYARRASLPAVVIVARGIRPLMRAFVEAYRPHVITSPTKEARWSAMRRCVERWNCFPNGNYQDPPIGTNPYAIDGYKTLGLEIWEQLGYRSPEWIFVATGYGDTLYGLYKAFDELRALGLADVPRLGAGEATGSLSDAIENRGPFPGLQPVGDIEAFSIANAQSTYQAVSAVESSRGKATHVSEDEIIEAQRLLATAEGMWAEASSAAALAALMRNVSDGALTSQSEVVLIMTSTGLKGASPPPSDDRIIDGDAELDAILSELTGQSARQSGDGIY